MSFTRFHDDPARIKKQTEESSFAGKYFLTTPGPGKNLPFVEDPQMRLQFWGANLMSNTVNLESDLRGLSRKLNRDDIKQNEYKMNAAGARSISYPNMPSFIDESRATHPAWMYRDIDGPRWEEPFINPQANVEKKFPDNIQSRILAKDNYSPIIPDISTIGGSFLTINDYEKHK